MPIKHASRPTLDPRRHPYKSDIAAAHLDGKVVADRFVEGRTGQVSAPVADLWSSPNAETRVSQVLLGERFTTYQTEGAWVWGQLETDGYVGWVHETALNTDPDALLTHRVRTLMTWAYPGTIKRQGFGPIPMGACVEVADPAISVDGSSARFAQTKLGAIHADHLCPIDQFLSDWVAVAENFIGVPYLWGGRSPLGIDCSALIQLALQHHGVAAPRDSDMQEAELGEVLCDPVEHQRGDILFWPGHVGVMVDQERLLHANAHAMATVYEPLGDVIARAGPVRSRKRIVQ